MGRFAYAVKLGFWLGILVVVAFMFGMSYTR